MVIPKMRAALAEDEEAVAPLITKEVPTTLKSGSAAVEVWKSLVKVVKSQVGSAATVELKTMEPQVKAMTIKRLMSEILLAVKIELTI